MSSKYDIYRAAQDTGGPCPICNWRDGDGVRTCFYDSEYGVVKHQNSMAAAKRTMSEVQVEVLEAGEQGRPHSCGGTVALVDSYHYRCSKCGVEVKLWEHGVDPDIGLSLYLRQLNSTSYTGSFI